MTTEDAKASIVVTCQQTRFHLIDAPASKDIEIKGLTITIASANPETTSSSTTKGKSKAKSEGLEILNGAELRLKAGTHYALLGRNGTGKSTILRAISEKLIPGIPLRTRISILQQTGEIEEASSADQSSQACISNKPVLQYVVEGDVYRNELVHELHVLSNGIDHSGSPFAAVKAFRQVRHERLRRELFEVQKAARLRSGARGSDARKTLIAYEKKFEDSAILVDQDEGEISSEAIEEETKAAVDLQAELQTQLELMQVSDIEAKARIILLGLGFKEEMLTKPFSTLSGGWRMRCMLAAALTQALDIIILDEPTNFLDLLGIIWLQRYLLGLRTTSTVTLILVSHDRDFIDAVCEEVIILRDQKLTYFNGNLSSYEKDVRHQILRMTRMKEAQDRQADHMQKTIQNNIKVGKKTGDDNKLKQAKSRQKKIDDRMGLQVSAKGGRFKLNRDLEGFHLTSRAGIEIPQEERAVNMAFPPAPELRFPGSLVSLEKIAFQYPRTSKPVLHDIDLVLHMGDRVGLVGLNGCGKSTLIKLIVDETKASKGVVTRHSRVRIGYYSQHAVEELQELGRQEPGLTALALLIRRAGEGYLEQQARQLLGSMGLSGRVASDVPVSKLSGGQLVGFLLLVWLFECKIRG